MDSYSFDFTTFFDRRGQDADSVDHVSGVLEGYDIIPMWIADMSFETAPSVIEAVRSRLDKPHFGYFSPRAEWYDAIIGWHKARNGIEYDKRSICYVNSVLGGMVTCYDAFTRPGEPVLTHNPRYTGYATIDGSGRHTVHTDLIRDENGVWRMDFEDIESQIKKQHIRVFALCSAHNPTGRVWEKDELEQLVDICRRNGVIIVCDEIWSDIIIGNNKHTPILSVKGAEDITVAFYSTTKTFSLAGVKGAYAVIPDPDLRSRFLSTAGRTMLNQMSIFYMYSTIGAYSESGQAWADQLLKVLTTNIDIAYDRLTAHEGIVCSKPQGTYLLYPQTSEWEMRHGVSHEELVRRGVERGVIWIDGDGFGTKGTLRLNVAVPTHKLIEAMDRLDEFAFIE